MKLNKTKKFPAWALKRQKELKAKFNLGDIVLANIRGRTIRCAFGKKNSTVAVIDKISKNNDFSLDFGSVGGESWFEAERLTLLKSA